MYVTVKHVALAHAHLGVVEIVNNINLNYIFLFFISLTLLQIRPADSEKHKIKLVWPNMACAADLQSCCVPLPSYLRKKETLIENK